MSVSKIFQNQGAYKEVAADFSKTASTTIASFYASDVLTFNPVAVARAGAACQDAEPLGPAIAEDLGF